MNLASQVVLISGATGHVGRHLVCDLATRGARVVGVDRVSRSDEADDLDNVEHRTCDLTDHDAVDAFVSSVDRDDAPVTVLVNCAGSIHSEPLVNLLGSGRRHHDPATWRATLAANLDTAFLLGSCVAERMARRRTRGVIINVSSVAAAGNPGQTAYSAAKAGVEAMTVVWSRELAPFGIRSAAIAPGFLDTPSTHEAMKPKQVEAWIDRTPLRRLGALAELAHAVRFIVENDYFTGRVLELDGGLRI
jgi:3-oxoacyl-[acyl-carrier protein] reductase